MHSCVNFSSSPLAFWPVQQNFSWSENFVCWGTCPTNGSIVFTNLILPSTHFLSRALVSLSITIILRLAEPGEKRCYRNRNTNFSAEICQSNVVKYPYLPSKKLRRSLPEVSEWSRPPLIRWGGVHSTLPLGVIYYS